MFNRLAAPLYPFKYITGRGLHPLGQVCGSPLHYTEHRISVKKKE